MSSVGLRVGDCVCTRSDVRPQRFAGRPGTIAENRRGEIRLSFRGGHGGSIWFRASEVALIEAGYSVHTAPGRPAKPVRVPTDPEAA
jgi:hypothetical protein